MDTVEHVEDSSLNIQNEFFNTARKNHSRITVFLTNGQRISGLIRSFDKFTLIVETRNGDQMVFKHAITTVAAARPGDEEYRGSRPSRPPMGDRSGEQRPGGMARPPRTGPPGGPPRTGPPGAPGAPGAEGAHAGPKQPEGDRRPRGGSIPQGKSFGNFLDLSVMQKGKPEADPKPESAGRESAAIEKVTATAEKVDAAESQPADPHAGEKPATPEPNPTAS